MKTLTFTKAALKALRNMESRDSQAIQDKLESYARGEQQDVIKLKGSDTYRLRHGNFRALMSIGRNEIIVTVILDRRDVYR